MPRTKHFVVFFVGVAIVLFITLVVLLLKNAGASLTLVPTQRALAIEAMGTQNPTAVVVTDDVRESTRQSLMEKLRAFVPTEEPEPVVAVAETITAPAPVIAATPTTYLSCDNGVVSGSGIFTWGEVSVTRREGARMITSRALGDGGIPLRTLQLADTPRVTGQTGCLPEGMVGISLDGRVINAGAPFVTNAEGIAGYALDGFGIFGSNEDGASLNSKDLDECHGHVHPIVWNDAPTSMYHYHVTSDAPYTLSCFRGTPSSID
jgi:hypothetical protein